MIQNRSAPPGPIVPILLYKDVAAAIDWLTQAFGFVERLRTPPEPDGAIHHAQLATGEGCVILSAGTASRPAGFAQSVLVRVRKIDEHYDRARKFNVSIILPPDTKEFGERQYSAVDLEGNRWAFTESIADVALESWGAIAASLIPRVATAPRPRWCYIEIPAVDPRQSANFYETVFGWNIRHRNTPRPSFDDATALISGAFVAGRSPAREPGLLPYIWVDDLPAVAARIAASGGKIVDPPHAEGPGASIATFQDPTGNLIGLYEETPRS